MMTARRCRWTLVVWWLALAGAAVPSWLAGVDDSASGTWSMDDGGVVELRSSHGDVVVRVPLVNTPPPPLPTQTRLEAASLPEAGEGAWRVKRLCGHRVAWLSWSEGKLGYVDRYTKREVKELEFFCRVVQRGSRVMDLGVNHGLYFLLAGAIGAAEVRGVEAQGALASLVAAAAAVNGFDVKKKVRMFHNAILDISNRTVEVPEMARHHPRNEGGTASVGRLDVKGVPLSKVTTVTAAAVWSDATTFIDFLKIDVEGVELAALRSAAPLFESRRVQHAVVEFGPAARWTTTAETAHLANLDPSAAREILAGIRKRGYRTLVGGPVHDLCAKVAGCPVVPPHTVPLAELTDDSHLDAALSKNHELSLYISIINDNRR